MLTTLRNHSQSWLIKVLLGLLIVFFVISFGVGTITQTKEVLVTVDGHEILVQEFQRDYNREMERLQERFGENAERIAASQNLKQIVVDRLINRYLVLEDARAGGLAVAEDEVREIVTTDPAFQVNNNFDYQTYREILGRANMAPNGYETQLMEDLLVRKQQAALAAGLFITDTEVEERFKVENEKVEVEYLYFDPQRFPHTAAIAADDLKQYYEKNPNRFRQGDQFKIEYLVLPLSAVEEGLDVRDRAIERYYERNKETEFTTPRRVRASHILKRLGSDAPTEEVEKTRAEMESILARAKKGENFAALAKAHSDDGTRDKGGDLGFFRNEEMVPEFSAAAFALKPGELSEVVRSAFGMHIIKLTGDEPAQIKDLEQARPAIAEKLKNQLAERRMNLEKERLPARIKADGMAAVAAEKKLNTATTDWFDARTVSPELGAMAPLYRMVAGKAAGETGVWERNPVQGHVFYRIAEKKDAYTKPFEEVKAEVEKQVRLVKQKEAATAEARKMHGEIKDAAAFQRYARSKTL